MAARTLTTVAAVIALSTAGMASAAAQTTTSCGTPPVGYNVIVSNARFIAGTTGRDFICAGDAVNTIRGKGKADIIYGGGGNDIIFGGYGNDFIRGGAGDDTITAGGGADLVHADAGNDTVRGGQGHDTVHGNSGNDNLTGGDGNDRLHGNSGNDNLTGNKGFDQLEGGNDDDVLNGGNGNDNLNGGQGDDVLNGGTHDDFLRGKAGDDQLRGGSGDDDLNGGNGTDVLNGGTGIDNCREPDQAPLACELIDGQEPEAPVVDPEPPVDPPVDPEPPVDVELEPLPSLWVFAGGRGVVLWDVEPIAGEVVYTVTIDGVTEEAVGQGNEWVFLGDILPPGAIVAATAPGGLERELIVPDASFEYLGNNVFDGTAPAGSTVLADFLVENPDGSRIEAQRAVVTDTNGDWSIDVSDVDADFGNTPYVKFGILDEDGDQLVTGL